MATAPGGRLLGARKGASMQQLRSERTGSASDLPSGFCETHELSLLSADGDVNEELPEPAVLKAMGPAGS
jgi:hypothetical protein